MPHKMHPSPAFMTAGVTVVRFLCGLFSASASAFVQSKGIASEREREKEKEKEKLGCVVDEDALLGMKAGISISAIWITNVDCIYVITRRLFSFPFWNSNLFDLSLKPVRKISMHVRWFLWENSYVREDYLNRRNYCKQ